MTEVWINVPRSVSDHGQLVHWCMQFCDSIRSRFVKVIDLQAGWGSGCDKAKVLVERRADSCDGNLGIGSYMK